MLFRSFTPPATLALILLAALATVSCKQESSSTTQPQIASEAQPAASPSGDPATISGKITLAGPAPSPTNTPMDPQCSALHQEPPRTRVYVVGAGKGLADVVVYLKEGLPSADYPMPDGPLIIDQEGCEYVPYVAAARTGQTIRVTNSDPLLHNVHPAQAVDGNREYNKAQLPKGPPLDFQWSNPELFLRFRCDVHPWMYAYVSLFDHPYFAVTDENGQFTIENVPPGNYVLEIAHRKTGTVTLDLKIEPGETETVDVELKAP